MCDDFRSQERQIPSGMTRHQRSVTTCHPKIAKLRSKGFVKHNILWFNISVNEAQIMQKLQPSGLWGVAKLEILKE